MGRLLLHGLAVEAFPEVVLHFNIGGIDAHGFGNNSGRLQCSGERGGNKKDRNLHQSNDATRVLLHTLVDGCKHQGVKPFQNRP